MVIHGTGGPANRETWDSLRAKNLVVGRFGDGAEMQLSPEFKQFVVGKIQAEMRATLAAIKSTRGD